MGKLISPIIIGFLLGLTGGGFFSVYQVSSQHATAVEAAKKNGIKPDTSAKRDSTGADSASHGADHAAAPAADDPAAGTPVVAAAPAADTAHAAATHTAAKPPAPVPAAVAAKPAAAAGGSDAPTDAETASHQRRLAKIFATMGAKDAARVLGQMSDNDVGVILNLLGDRQAAAILISLPAPRAALLSQMQPRRTGGSE